MYGIIVQKYKYSRDISKGVLKLQSHISPRPRKIQIGDIWACFYARKRVQSQNNILFTTQRIIELEINFLHTLIKELTWTKIIND